MVPDPRILRAYVDHFLPRDVVGVVFLLSILLVAYWGTVDEGAVEELHERVEEIREEEAEADAAAEEA